MLPTASVGNQACLTALTPTAATSIPVCSNASGATGALRLTTNADGSEGAVFNTLSLPFSQGLDIKFNTYQFASTGSGADGISFALAAANPANPQPPVAAGPSGGSLGYSTSQTLAGIPNGYLGFGFDVYGNYLNTTSEAATGCSAVTGIGNNAYPQSVTVRGPGNGTTNGYCLLSTSANQGGRTPTTSGSNLQGAGALDSSTSQAVPVEIAINPSLTATATTSGFAVPAGDYMVAYTPIGGTQQSFTGALPNLNSAPEGISAAWFSPTTGYPYQVTFGWTASTGSANEYHEITSMASQTLNGPLPTLQLADTDNASGVFTQGTTTTHITLTPSLGSSANEANPPTVTDVFPTGVVPSTPIVPGWDCGATAGQTVSCTYTGTEPVASGTSYPGIVVPISVLSTATPGAGTDSARVSSIDALPVTAADSFSVAQPPTAPTINTVTVGGAAAKIVFTAPSSTGSSPITGYAITPVLTGTAQTVQTFNSTATTETVIGLTSGGTYTFEVAAINSVGTGPNSAASTAMVVTGAAPSITTSTLPSGTVGVFYTQTLTATAGTMPYAWTETGALPTGITLTTGGLLSGTTTVVGSPSIVVTLTDHLGETATQSLTLAILPAGPAPGTPGAPVAVGGTGLATVTVTPPGSGAPTSYTVTAVDVTNSARGNQTCTVTGATGSCTESGLTNGDSYSFTSTATNGNGTSAASVASNSVIPAAPATVAIGVGSNPMGMTVNSAGTLGYVANEGNNTISVINLATGVVTGTVAVGSEPEDVLLNPAGTIGYVTNAGANPGTVTVLNLTTSPPAVLETVTLSNGVGPTSMTVNPAGTAGFVVSGTSGTVTALNLTTSPPTVTGTVTLPVGSDPTSVTVNPAGTEAYVTNANGTVSVLNVTSSPPTVLATVAVGSDPTSITLNPAGTIAYVTNANGTVSVVNLTTNPPTVIATVLVGSDPTSIKLNAAGTIAYVTNAGSGTVSVINLTTTPPTVIATVPVGSDPTSITLNPAGTIAYVTNTSTGTVTAIATIAPGTPGQASALAGSDQATVTVVAPSTGGVPLSYTVTATDTTLNSGGGQTCTVSGSSGSCAVTGLTAGNNYTFTSTATTSGGTSGPSAPSIGMTPLVPAPGGLPPVTTTVPVTAPGTPPLPGPFPGPAPSPISPITLPLAVIGATGGSTAETPGGLGYWSLTPAGKLSEHGNAGNFGSENLGKLNAPIVAISSTSNGEGYWLASSDGGVFNFGDATFHGSLGHKHLNSPIIGIIGTPDNGGYLLAASDGGVFAFGDAKFQGSMGSKHLNQRIVGMVPTPTGTGYMLLGADGGVFTFGGASFEGSLGATATNHIVAMALTPNGKGYWLVGAGGKVYTFGNAKSFGSVAAKSGDKVVGIIANGNVGYRLITSSGKSIAFGTVPAS
jgi:YVTN family beta-propeller protein